MKTPMQELFERFGHLLPDIQKEFLEKEASQFKPKWISVEEQGFPKQAGKYVFYHTDSKIPILDFFIPKAKDDKYMSKYYTHWMPLPEPPKTKYYATILKPKKIIECPSCGVIWNTLLHNACQCGASLVYAKPVEKEENWDEIFDLYNKDQEQFLKNYLRMNYLPPKRISK